MQIIFNIVLTITAPLAHTKLLGKAFNLRLLEPQLSPTLSHALPQTEQSIKASYFHTHTHKLWSVLIIMYYIRNMQPVWAWMNG